MAETSSLPTGPGALTDSRCGLNISQSSNHLRNYVMVEKARMRILAGWFLRIRDFDYKHKLAYHLYDATEHVSWCIARLKEMRGGNPNASIRPELKQFLEETLHAPDDNDFLCGFYGVLTEALYRAVEEDLKELDPSGNANERRLLQRVRLNLKEELEWFNSLALQVENSIWANSLRKNLKAMGFIHGNTGTSNAEPFFDGPHFERPRSILFEDCISIGELETYESRLQMDTREATIEQFKVFFNEFYAAALLASILFDASYSDYPWEFFADFSRHFWDEARHSEFGAIRLRELGVEPDRVNPILFEESQGLPILHRVVYLTRCLEAYFMPRKPKRMKEYEESGDLRSQLFADQDWSDEINHVRYGSRWADYLLEDDHREISDITEEIKTHLSQVRGYTVKDITAPF